MDVTVSAPELKKALRVPKASANLKAGPPWNAVRLIAVNGTLSVQAADGQQLATSRCPANVARSGKAVVGIAQLEKLLKAKGDVQILADAEKITIINGVTAKVPAISPDDWPRPWKSFASAPSFTVKAADVAEVLPAAAKDKARPVLMNVYFHDGDMVATDSYRLHIVRGVETLPFSVMLPTSLLAQVARSGHDAQVSVIETTHSVPGWKDEVITKRVQQARIICGPNTWYVFPEEDGFPNYRQLIPSSYPHRLVIERDPFVALIEQVRVLDDGAAPVRLELTKTSLTARFKSYETDVSGTLACGWDGPEFAAENEGEEGSYAFNPEFLVGCVKAASEDTVAIGVLDHLKPVIFTEGRQDGTTSIRLLMPVRVR